MPLNTIVMGTECLSKLCDDAETSDLSAICSNNEDTQEMVAGVLEDFKVATTSIEDMLRNCNIYQLLEDKKFVLEKKEFPLSKMLHEADSLSRLQWSGLNLHIKVADGLPQVVVGNCQLLTFFLTYVILNSAKRSKDTGVVVVEVKPAPDSKKTNASEGIFNLVINVIDSGDRLNDMEAEEMFSAFSALDTRDEMDKVSDQHTLVML